MSRFELDRNARDSLARTLARWLKDELDVEVGTFEAGDLVVLLAESMGPVFYNQGLRDAQALLRARMEVITDAVADLEKPEKL